jgi:hypothetical protein
MNSNFYDIIIIGAGLSGLYSAYNIKKMDPSKKFLILESNKKPYIGGRVGNDNFYGTEIVVGAGVGRKDTDKLLIKLLNELDIDFKPFKVLMNYSSLIENPINVKNCLAILRKEYNKLSNHPSITFKQFAKHYLGNKNYERFIISAGYRDYEEEDVYEVLYHYQMDDNAPGWTALDIHWSNLIDSLCNKIGYQNIKTSNKVEKITKTNLDPCMFEIVTEKGVKYHSNKVIVATRISSVQKLLPSFPIYNQIHGQPFLYVYAKFTKKSAEIMNQYVPYYTIVPGPLQKMVPFDPSKGIYMIAYCDNKNAKLLNQNVENTESNRRFFEREVEKSLDIKPNSLKIISIKHFYWPIGTHYYEPLDTNKFKNREEFIYEAQHPEKCLLVVGEAVSRRQGWTEGALESVHAVLNKKWIKSN